jgi:hypothetical protein
MNMAKQKDIDLEEKILKAAKEQPFTEQTELGQVMNNLDADVKDELTGMSTIDFNADLSPDEIKLIMIIDEFRRLGILPAKKINITTQFKRLSVSKNRQGRTEKVAMTQGMNDMKSGARNMGFLGRMFQPKQ